MMALLYVFAMLLLFGASIFVHELGHFLAARAFGMVADVFSIGLGPALWKRKVGATTYKIGWIPFGGYVALPQMDPNSFLEGERSESGGREDGSADRRPPAADRRTLPRVSPGKKIVVSVAGAAGNVAFAFLLATVVWFVGKPSSLQERNAVVGFVATNSPALALGVAVGDEILAIDGQPVATWQQVLEKTALAPAARPLVLRLRARAGAEREVALATEKSPVGVWMLPGLDGMDPCHVAAVYPQSGAAAADLRPGDRIVRFDGQDVFSRAHLSQLVEAAAGRPAAVEFLRAGQTLSASVESTWDEGLQRHLIGIQFNTLADLDYAALSHPTPWAQVQNHAGAIFSFLRALATPATSGVAAEAVGGPVLILLMLWLMLKSSFVLAVWFTGFLNVNLAIINLLPLPVLDGGHVVVGLWEAVARRPASARVVNALANLFAVFFIGLFLLLTFRDSVRHLAPPLQRWLAGESNEPPTPAVFESKP